MVYLNSLNRQTFFFFFFDKKSQNETTNIITETAYKLQKIETV